MPSVDVDRGVRRKLRERSHSVAHPIAVHGGNVLAAPAPRRRRVSVARDKIAQRIRLHNHYRRDAIVLFQHQGKGLHVLRLVLLEIGDLAGARLGGAISMREIVEHEDAQARGGCT